MVLLQNLTGNRDKSSVFQDPSSVKYVKELRASGISTNRMSRCCVFPIQVKVKMRRVKHL